MMEGLEQLLEVQALDTRLDQLRHRREVLPERGELARLEGEIEVIDRSMATQAEARDELAKEQRRREDEVSALTAKIADEDRRLYHGGITSPREAQALQEELKALARRQQSLEDQILELMEQQEPLDAAISEMQAARAEVEGRAEELRGRISQATSEIDAEISEVEGERTSAAAVVPAELLEEYERLRGRLGGIGVARLSSGRCGGCNLTLSAVEQDRIKSLPSDAMVHCEECGRLLVH